MNNLIDNYIKRSFGDSSETCSTTPVIPTSVPCTYGTLVNSTNCSGRIYYSCEVGDLRGLSSKGSVRRPDR